ncbi:BQ5605_C016g08190 [Microbotryum silenes-dioicae]|uniref:BQ5605_C016g08190 protein n=1 Tax=Microbotryum silenes-dioicae TaxID=796604 RepID=A0A2X0NZ23_9BASI|nr:BQ5605_C016g08190 [Microbotryum silenes-dioicae]
MVSIPKAPAAAVAALLCEVHVPKGTPPPPLNSIGYRTFRNIRSSLELSASAPELPPDEPTPFISKLSHILELAEHRESDGVVMQVGRSIILASHHLNLLKALSQYFKYTTITSLIRQLNIYSFKRLTTTQLLDVLDLTRPTKLSASDYCGFAHPKCFRLTLDRRCSLGDFKPLSKQRSRKSTRRHSAGDEPNLGTMRHAVLSRDQSSIGHFGDLGMH